MTAPPGNRYSARLTPAAAEPRADQTAPQAGSARNGPAANDAPGGGAPGRPPPHISFADFVQVWNGLQTLDMPLLHRRIAGWLDGAWRRGRRKLLLLAFRGAGKSTLVGLYCAWLLVRQPDLRILVLAADLPLARKMVRNVRRIVERHPLTRHLRPARADQWAADQFTVVRAAEARDPSLLARGIGGNVTGCRADVVICDDVEVPRTADTAPKREDLRQRLAEVDYVLTPGGQQLYIGTPHAWHSIYAADARETAGEAAPFLDGFDRLEIPLLDADGVSAWPERFGPVRIAEVRRRTGPAKFQSQMQLEPVDLAQARLDPAGLRRYQGELDLRRANGESVLRLGGRRLTGATCWWDPAFGRPDRGDASVVAIVFTGEDHTWWLHDVAYLTATDGRPGDDDAGGDMAGANDGAADADPAAIQLCRQVARFAARNHAPAVTVETNGIGAYLPGLLRTTLRREGLRVRVIGHAARTPKDLRILSAIEPMLASRELHVHARVWETPLIREMRDWRPDGGSRQRDDGLDAMAGCLLATPAPIPRLTLPKAAPDWRAGGGGYRADAGFEV